MKDTRFTELINLYIDRQISPDEAAELELEIQTNPGRRQVYQQYCRMHRATKLVYENFRAHAGEESRTVAHPATIAHIESRKRQRRARWVYAAGGLAAAACFTLVVARVNFISSGAAEASATPLAAAMTPPAAPAEVAALPVEARREAARAEAQAGLASLRNNVFVEIDYAAMVAALREEEERLLALPRAGNPARVASLFDDGVFETRQDLSSRNQGSLRSRQQKPQVEFTAFQFQR